MARKGIAKVTERMRLQHQLVRRQVHHRPSINQTLSLAVVRLGRDNLNKAVTKC